MTTQATYKWDVVGDVVISVAGVGEMPDDAYNAWVQELNSSSIRSLLAASLGTLEVSSLQRKRATEVMLRRGIKGVVVTDDRLVRGFVTAASWLGANLKAFSWLEARTAVKHLGLSSTAEDHAIDILTRLKREVARPRDRAANG